MSSAERRLWNLVRIPSVKWRQEPWEADGGDFWVVGILGAQVVWCSDIEHGFNTSRYMTHGLIEEYWCNQDELHHVIASLRQHIESGQVQGKLGPPQPLVDDPRYT